MWCKPYRNSFLHRVETQHLAALRTSVTAHRPTGSSLLGFQPSVEEKTVITMNARDKANHSSKGSPHGRRNRYQDECACMTRLWQSKPDVLGGIVKRSLAMVFLGCGATIAKAFGLDDATRPDCYFLVVHPWGAATAIRDLTVARPGVIVRES